MGVVNHISLPTILMMKYVTISSISNFAVQRGGAEEEGDAIRLVLGAKN